MILTRTRRHRRISLTPMIDVVFLLLVFFMLAARFGVEGTVTLNLGAESADYQGPPRLLDVFPGDIRLNGVPIETDALIAALSSLTSQPDDAIVLRARDGADVQRLLDLVESLNAAGFSALALSE